jgi:hypothetical protein
MDSVATWVSGIMSLGTLAVVFRAGQTVAHLETSQRALEERLQKLDRMDEKLENLGILQSRICTLENAVGKMTSDFPRVFSRVAVLEQRATSTDRFRAASQSRPHIDPEGE